jgi:hypothetical protein
MNTYNINVPLDFDERIAQGSATVSIQVHGYWSRDPITVYINREHFYDDSEPKWVFKVSHSSGGRDTDKLPSHIEAARNFGNALVAASEFAESMSLKIDEFETMYQYQMNSWKEEQVKERLAKEARIEQDNPLGVHKAKELINELINNRATLPGGFIKGMVRGEPHMRYTFTVKSYGNVVLYYSGSPVSKKEAIDQLSLLSNRTTYTGK